MQADAPGLQAPPPAPLPETALGAGQQPQPSLAPHSQAQLANAGADAVLDRDSSASAAPPAVTPGGEAPQAAARKVPSWLKPRGKGAAAAVAGGEVPAWMGREGRKGRVAASPTIAPALAVAGVARAMARGYRSWRGGAIPVGMVATGEAMMAAGIPVDVLPSKVAAMVKARGGRWSGGTGQRCCAAGAWLAKVLGERVGLRWFVAAAVAHYGKGKRPTVRRNGKASGRAKRAALQDAMVRGDEAELVKLQVKLLKRMRAKGGAAGE